MKKVISFICFSVCSVLANESKIPVFCLNKKLSQVVSCRRSLDLFDSMVVVVWTQPIAPTDRHVKKTKPVRPQGFDDEYHTRTEELVLLWDGYRSDTDSSADNSSRNISVLSFFKSFIPGG